MSGTLQMPSHQLLKRLPSLVLLVSFCLRILTLSVFVGVAAKPPGPAIGTISKSVYRFFLLCRNKAFTPPGLKNWVALGGRLGRTGQTIGGDGRIDGIFHVYPDNIGLYFHSDPIWELEVYRVGQALNCNRKHLSEKYIPWFNRGLKRIKADGTLEKLFMKYFESPYSEYLEVLDSKGSRAR